ncbi:hypothetical protein T439DRAFT_356180 [Meredithblackwellia eburnea MCA 4105]
MSEIEACVEAYPDDDFWISYEKGAGLQLGKPFIDLTRGGAIRLGDSGAKN